MLVAHFFGWLLNLSILIFLWLSPWSFSSVVCRRAEVVVATWKGLKWLRVLYPSSKPLTRHYYQRGREEQKRNRWRHMAFFSTSVMQTSPKLGNWSRERRKGDHEKFLMKWLLHCQLFSRKQFGQKATLQLAAKRGRYIVAFLGWWLIQKCPHF